LPNEDSITEFLSIEKNESEIYDQVLIFVGEQLISADETNEELKNSYKKHVNDKIFNNLFKLTNFNQLSEFFPEKNLKPPQICEANNSLKNEIKNKNFENIKKLPKEEFFNEFLKLAQPSISHFLTYLEILKDFFILKKDEQELFLNLFFK